MIVLQPVIAGKNQNKLDFSRIINDDIPEQFTNYLLLISLCYPNRSKQLTGHTIGITQYAQDDKNFFLII